MNLKGHICLYMVKGIPSAAVYVFSQQELTAGNIAGGLVGLHVTAGNDKVDRFFGNQFPHDHVKRKPTQSR